MIVFLSTAAHKYTHADIRLDNDAPEIEFLNYADVPKRIPERDSTCIFMDLDRLTVDGLRKTAFLYRRLREMGRNVVNDPARVASRQGLLRRLRVEGLNSFDAYRVEECALPARWPVFLRTDGNHAAPISALLNDPEELDAAVEKAVDDGFPVSSMLIIEYCAEPVRPGLFRRLSVFRVGDRLLGHTCAHDDDWLVKYGKPGIAPAELYEEEYQMVKTNPFGDHMRRVFDLAGVDYGRVDFGLVGGKPQVYEINTNPGPQGPFTDIGKPLQCGDGFVNIDPMAYDDPATGKRLLYWGSGFQPIKVQELARDRTSFAPGSRPIDLIGIIKTDDPNEYQKLVEGAWVIRRAGWYYLFYSGDNCCGPRAHYAVMIARSRSATGPFEPAPDKVILEARGNWFAPGHNSTVTDDSGRDWMIYHAVDRRRPRSKPGDDVNTRRVMLIDAIEWRDGWPAVDGPSDGPRPATVVRD